MLFHFTDIVLCTSPLTSITVIPNHFLTQAVSAHVRFGFILNVYAYEKKKNLNDNIMFGLMYTANIRVSSIFDIPTIQSYISVVTNLKIKYKSKYF